MISIVLFYLSACSKYLDLSLDKAMLFTYMIQPSFNYYSELSQTLILSLPIPWALVQSASMIIVVDISTDSGHQERSEHT